MSAGKAARNAINLNVLKIMKLLMGLIDVAECYHFRNPSQFDR